MEPEEPDVDPKDEQKAIVIHGEPEAKRWRRRDLVGEPDVVPKGISNDGDDRCNVGEPDVVSVLGNVNVSYTNIKITKIWSRDDFNTRQNVTLLLFDNSRNLRNY